MPRRFRLSRLSMASCAFVGAALGMAAVPLQALGDDPSVAKPGAKASVTEPAGKSTAPSNVPSKKSSVEKPESSKPEPGKPERARTDGAKPNAANGGAGKPNSQKGLSSASAVSREATQKPSVREGSALEFARRHHPELADLLVQLKKGNAGEYDRAIRELHQTSERLARIEEKTPDRYDFAIASWKLDSRVRLLSARMVMAESPALEAELKALLRERHELRLAELKRERDRAAARLAKLDADIRSLEQNPDAALQKELQTARKQLDAQANELKTKPTRKPGGDKTLPENSSAEESPSDRNPAKAKRVEKKPVDSKAAVPATPANAIVP